MEKPHIFLNRIKVRDTSQKDEVLESGQNYKKKEKMVKMDEDFFIGEENRMYREIYGASQPLVLPNTSINAHNNFLAYGGLTIENVKGDKI